MYNYEILDQYLDMTTQLRESTIRQLLKGNDKYERVSQEEDAAEAAYLQLDLTKAQRQIIEDYIAQKEISYILYADASYLAGIKNAMELQTALDIFSAKQNTEQKSE